MRSISKNRITQTAHGASRAVDYSASPDPYIYAPEDGIIDSYLQRGSGMSDAGLALRMRGANGLHQFAHTETSYVRVGQRVSKGQKLAKMGYTGYTIPKGPAGRHVHWWISTPSGYKYPPSLVNEPFNQPQGGSEVANRTQVDKIYRGILRRAGDAGGLNYYTGKDANLIVSDLSGSGEKTALDARLSQYESFYNAYVNQIGELSTRPTKAQLEALGKSLADEKAKVVAAERALEEAKKTGGGISDEDSAAIKDTNSIVKAIQNFLSRIFK